MSRAALARPYALARGTLWTVLAEGLMLPTGLITAALLSRALKPELYGLLALMGAILSWLEWSVTGFFSRATTKLVAEAEDWQPVGTRVLQLSLAAGVSVMLLLWLFSPLAARLLGAPEITPFLRLYALEAPLVIFSQSLRMVLIGLGRFNPRALASALRWMLRLGLVILFLGLGWSLQGAILANIGAAALEMALLLAVLRPPLLARSTFPARVLLAYGAPLTIYALALQLYQKVDLLLLQAIGGETLQSGYFAVAQNLAIIPSIVSMSFVPLLISSLSNQLSSGGDAPGMARRAVRFGLWLLPLGALVAGASSEITALLFGSDYLPGAPLLALLMLAGFIQLLFSIATGILTAGGFPRVTALLAAVMLAAAAGGHLLAIPRWGAAGAAWVTLLAGLGAALLAYVILLRLWRFPFPAVTLLRAALMGLLVGLAARLWPAPGWLLLVKLAGLGGLIPLGFAALGEFSAGELARARAALRPRRAA